MSAEPKGLAARIDVDLKEAMRSQDNVTKLTLRAVKTGLTEVSKPGTIDMLSEDQVMAVVQREAKKRREAAGEYEKVGATVQAEQERAELAVLSIIYPAN